MNEPPGNSPLVVRTGLLTQDEFNRLSAEEQAELERMSADLIRQYGEEFLRKDRERHRVELRIIGYL